MLTCPKCSKELADGARFCDNCGSQLFETIFCPNCGKQTSSEYAFCQNCGASVLENKPVEDLVEIPKAKKKFPKKLFLFGAIGVVAIALVAVVLSLFLGKGKTDKNYAMYIKDREIFFTDLKKDAEPWQITSHLVDADSDEVDDYDLASASAYISEVIYMSEDGKYIFFPDKIGEDDDGFNLYYRETKDAESEAVKIDSDVQLYSVSKDNTIVTYVKGDDYNLYQYNLKEDTKDKLASEINMMRVTEDGSKVIYMTDDGSIYQVRTGEEKEKIASDATRVEYISDDLSTVYYVKDEALYKKSEEADKEKIASDIYEVVKIYESGEVYYLTAESEEVNLMDYVTDDKKEEDAALTEPEYPTYPKSPSRPYWWDYDTDAEYEAAYEAYEKAYEDYEAECNRLRDAYDAAYEAYWEKLYRDELREELEDEVLEQETCTLYFYNGSEKVMITETAVQNHYTQYVSAADAPVIIYEAYEQEELEKVKLSEIESAYEVESLVEEALYSSAVRYVAVKDAATVIEQEEEATSFSINASGTTIYYIDEMPEDKDYGELYCISIEDGVVGKPEVYDSDVYAHYQYFRKDGKFVYFKDCDDDSYTGEFFVDKEKIDYDVMIYSTAIKTEGDELYYIADYDMEDQCGTLKVYRDGENEKIADDVSDCVILPDGRVLYLYDYSRKHYKGELHEWADGETRKIDDDVVGLIRNSENQHRGF